MGETPTAVDQLIDEVDDRFPRLVQFFGLYFHDGWSEEFGGVDGAVDAFRQEEPEGVAPILDEFDDLMSAQLDDQALPRLLHDGFYCSHDVEPGPADWTGWIAAIRERLARPSVMDDLVVDGDPDTRKRWDDDERRRGIATASHQTAAIQELLDLAGRPDWVTEDATEHLLPHLTTAVTPPCRITGSTISPLGTLVVHIEHPPTLKLRDIRQVLWTLIGAVAEATTHGRERITGDIFELLVVTGMPDGGADFAAHGHTVQLIAQPATARARARSCPPPVRGRSAR